MDGRKPNAVVVFLGNPLMGDDSVGLRIGWMLEPRLRELGVETTITTETGLALADHMHGKDLAIIVDAVATGRAEPGTVVIRELSEAEATGMLAPHYMGIPEVLHVMEEMGLGAPEKVYLVGIGIRDPYTISENLSPELEERLQEIAEAVYMAVTRLIGIND